MAKLTIAIHRTVSTRLLSVAFYLFPTAFIAGTSNTSALLDRKTWRVVAGRIFTFSVSTRLSTPGW